MGKKFYNIHYAWAFTARDIRATLKEYDGLLIKDLGQLGILCYVEEEKIPALKEALSKAAPFVYRDMEENVYWNRDVEHSRRFLQLT